MKIKNLITIALAAIMSVSAMSIPTFAENNTTIDEQLFIDTAKDAIYDYIVERGEEYYTISDVSFNDGDIKYESDNKVSFETTATIRQKLKASDVEELPYIQGYLNAAGISSYADIQKSTDVSSVLNENATVLNAERVLKVISDRVDAVNEYIGEETEISMDFYVSINPQTAITKDNIQLNCIDSLGNIVSTDEYLLPTYETMYQSGAEELTATIEEISSTVEPMKNVDNWSNYNRIAARDYARKWWGPYTSNYNPAYNNYVGKGGDCANFVSQCVYAGGVPIHGGWSPDSVAWINAASLKNNMLQYGYATKEDAWETNAGNFAYTTAGQGHIVLVTLNDTVTLAYTAHTTNCKDQPFTQATINGGYSFYIIKNF